mmetsp:Transcript_36694/g.84427  ORF Transcript_36694/g.84427 Transcript_36694/m.84427 type:complete len:394 (+) Transcript_36694:122-1303(+)
MAQLPFLPPHRWPKSLSLAAVGLLEVLLTMLVIFQLLRNTLGDDARQTCVWAGRHYNEGARFDNTWLTYCSDYAIAVLCAAQACWHASCTEKMSTLRSRVVLLLASYSACMALAGSLHHLHDGTQADLNSLQFRAGWTSVVLLTSLAGVVMGLIACELLRLLHDAEATCKEEHNLHLTTGYPHSIVLADNTAEPAHTQHGWPHRLKSCPSSLSRRGAQNRSRVRHLQRGHPHEACLVPPKPPAVNSSPNSSRPLRPNRSLPQRMLLAAAQEGAWLAYGCVLSVLAVAGVFSCQRPACDVFIAGSTQSPASLFLQLALLIAAGAGGGWREAVVCVSLVASAPLAYAYPWLVLHSGLSLGAVNSVLHVVIGLSWGLQGALLLSTCERHLPHMKKS